jgi:hypothetical protein
MQARLDLNTFLLRNSGKSACAVTFVSPKSPRLRFLGDSELGKSLRSHGLGETNSGLFLSFHFICPQRFLSGFTEACLQSVNPVSPCQRSDPEGECCGIPTGGLVPDLHQPHTTTFPLRIASLARRYWINALQASLGKVLSLLGIEALETWGKQT